MKTPALPRLAALLAAGLLPSLAARADVQADWAAHCATCHGRDGAAKTKAARLCGAKDLTDPQYQKAFSDEVMFRDLKDGLVQDGKTKMKPYAGRLSDDQLRGLVAFVRTLAK
jgi:cytochrome c553